MERLYRAFFMLLKNAGPALLLFLLSMCFGSWMIEHRQGYLNNGDFDRLSIKHDLAVPYNSRKEATYKYPYREQSNWLYVVLHLRTADAFVYTAKKIDFFLTGGSHFHISILAYLYLLVWSAGWAWLLQAQKPLPRRLYTLSIVFCFLAALAPNYFLYWPTFYEEAATFALFPLFLASLSADKHRTALWLLLLLYSSKLQYLFLLLPILVLFFSSNQLSRGFRAFYVLAVLAVSVFQVNTAQEQNHIHNYHRLYYGLGIVDSSYTTTYYELDRIQQGQIGTDYFEWKLEGFPHKRKIEDPIRRMSITLLRVHLLQNLGLLWDVVQTSWTKTLNFNGLLTNLEPKDLAGKLGSWSTAYYTTCLVLLLLSLPLWIYELIFGRSSWHHWGLVFYLLAVLQPLLSFLGDGFNEFSKHNALLPLLIIAQAVALLSLYHTQTWTADKGKS